jgi:hypothetical protein
MMGWTSYGAHGGNKACALNACIFRKTPKKWITLEKRHEWDVKPFPQQVLEAHTVVRCEGPTFSRH